MKFRPTGVCALCLQQSLLCKSHLLPAALYRFVRAIGAKNPNPRIFTPEFDGQGPEQWKAYLLCEECEKRFSVQGEEWVMRHCCRSTSGNFLLRDILRSGTPVATAEETRTFAASQFSDVQTEKLIYFALSVYWRASAYRWQLRGMAAEPLKLGPWAEQIRLYLLGRASLPKNLAMSVWVSDAKEPWLTFHLPFTTGRREHYLSIPGIGFHLMLHPNMPEAIYKMSITTPPAHPISLSRIFEEQIRQKFNRTRQRRSSSAGLNG